MLSFVQKAKVLAQAPDTLTLEHGNPVTVKDADVGKVLQLSVKAPETAEPSVSLKAALKCLNDYGFKLQELSVQTDHNHYETIGSLSPTSFVGQQTIEANFMVLPPSAKYGEVMTELHEIAGKYGSKYGY
jgi:hypothetical protein